MADFSTDHVGKRVLDADGTELGTVSDVRNGDLYVDVDPDADRDTVSELGWDGPVTRDPHRLPDRYVSNVTETAVRVRV